MASVYLYDRAELLNKLKQVAPALSKSDLHPQLQQVHFTEFGLLAYDDRIALIVSLADGPPIGVNGERLIKLLATAKDPQVRFTLADNGALTLDAHGFSASLHTNPEPPFRWPITTDDLPALYIDAPLAAALQLIAKTKIVIEDSPKPQARGVTLLCEGDFAVLYATDSKTLLRQELPASWSGTAPGPAVLSLPCIVELARLAPGWLRLGRDHVLFDTDDLMVSLWARCIVPEDWIDFASVMEERRPPGLQALPEGFEAMVKRAGVMVVKNHKDRKRCRMQLDGSHLEIISSGPGGQLTDRLDFEHTPLSVVFDQIVMERFGSHGLSLLGVSPKALHMASPDARISYLMATLNERD